MTSNRKGIKNYQICLKDLMCLSEKRIKNYYLTGFQVFLLNWYHNICGNQDFQDCCLD